MTKKRSYTGNKANSAARRAAIKNLTAGSVIASAAAAMPNNWIKPVVQSVVLPAHAEGSPMVECFPISVNFTPDFDANASNNIGAGIFEITSTAPFDQPVTINTVTVSTGTLSGHVPALPAEISTAQNLLIDWISFPGFLNQGIPLLDLDVSIAWTCADGQQGTLNETVVTSGAQPASQPVTQEDSTDEPEEEPVEEIVEQPLEAPVVEETTEPEEDSGDAAENSPPPA